MNMEDKINRTNKTRSHVDTLFNVTAGAGAVVAAAYLVSRIRERQEMETRLERLEQMAAKLSAQEGSGQETEGKGF